jgi:cytosine/uracil/thiamine/allantoin permease
MLSFFLFWSIQFPVMLATPHKLKWLFVLKGGKINTLAETLGSE